MMSPSAKCGPSPIRSEPPRALIAAASAAAALLAWELAARFGAYPAHLFPPPTAVLHELALSARSGELLADLTASGRRWAAGLALGSILGAAAGLLTGAWRPARLTASPLLHLVRAVPFMMLMPLALLWFGIGEASKILVTAWGAFFPVWLSTEAAVLGVEKEYVWAARTLGAEGPRLWFEVHWRRCLPGVATGLRLAVATAMFSLAAAEMVGSFDGLAFRAFYSYQMFQSEKMVACIVVVGAAGFTLDYLFAAAARRLLPWREEEE
jgi:NitT/TauT family transport system permease protein/sulfonate transport system permease protein